jgi:hypothetical protein
LNGTRKHASDQNFSIIAAIEHALVVNSHKANLNVDVLKLPTQRAYHHLLTKAIEPQLRKQGAREFGWLVQAGRGRAGFAYRELGRLTKCICTYLS